MEKPKDEAVQMLDNEKKQEMNHILGNESNDYRDTIFGLFYRLSFGTLVINNRNEEKKKPGLLSSIKHCLPLLVGIPILLRTIFLAIQLSKTTLLTKNCAINLALLVTSVHGFVSFIILFIWNSNNFLNEFAHQFYSFFKSRDKKIDAKAYRTTHILTLVFFVIYMYSFVFFGIENYVFYDEHASKVNSTAFFRQSVTSSITLWPVDFLVIVFTAFVSAIQLSYYIFINTALVIETEQFNSDLKKAGENDQLKNVDFLNSYSNQNLELLTLIRFASKKLNMVATPNLMFFILCHFSLMFVMRGFSEELELHQKLFIINLLVASAIALAVTIKRPAALHKQVHKTKNIIFFQKLIWDNSDVKASVISNSIIDRITNANFFTVVFDGFVLNERFFHIIFLIFPLLIEFLAPWKKYME